MKRMDLEYSNPWHTSPYTNWPNGPQVYVRSNALVYESPCGRGKIVKVLSDWWDYLINDKVVTQRVSNRPELLEELIGAILDHKETDNCNIERARECYEKQLGK